MSIAPSYWKYHGRPVRVVSTEDGGLTVERFDPEAQEWELRLGVLSAILGGDPDADELSQEDFDRWIAALRSGAGEEEGWESVLARSSSLVEGTVEAIQHGELSVRGRWWKAIGGLLPTVRSGDWIQLRIDGDAAVITELRPAHQAEREASRADARNSAVRAEENDWEAVVDDGVAKPEVE